MLSKEAKNLLSSLHQKQKAGGRGAFDVTDYISIPNYDSVLSELEVEGCIEIANDIAGTVTLTQRGISLVN